MSSSDGERHLKWLMHRIAVKRAELAALLEEARQYGFAENLGISSVKFKAAEEATTPTDSVDVWTTQNDGLSEPLAGPQALSGKEAVDLDLVHDDEAWLRPWQAKRLLIKELPSTMSMPWKAKGVFGRKLRNGEYPFESMVREDNRKRTKSKKQWKYKRTAFLRAVGKWLLETRPKSS